IRRPDAELARDRAAQALDLVITEVTDAAGRAEVAALPARVFSDGRGSDGMGAGEANRHISRIHAARRPSGELVGYSAVWLVLDELHVHSIGVDPGSRRKGVGNVLMERVLSDARAAGASSATLEVRASNHAARALYERLGFTVEATRPSYYRNPTEDALILWRRNL